MVLSTSSPVPHLVKQGSGAQYVCDSKCINWTSSGLCSHALAVAEVNGGLPDVVQQFHSATESYSSCYIWTSIWEGKVAPRRRSRKVACTPEVSTLRPVFLDIDTASSSTVSNVSSSSISNVSACTVSNVSASSVSNVSASSICNVSDSSVSGVSASSVSNVSASRVSNVSNVSAL